MIYVWIGVAISFYAAGCCGAFFGLERSKSFHQAVDDEQMQDDKTAIRYICTAIWPWIVVANFVEDCLAGSGSRR